jgi:hypothetical protein
MADVFTPEPLLNTRVGSMRKRKEQEDGQVEFAVGRRGKRFLALPLRWQEPR